MPLVNAASVIDREARQRFESWKTFHVSNPAVFDLFLHFSRRAASLGRRKIGARLIGERIRWETAVETIGSEYKVNNNFWPYYARLAMLVDANLDGIFERRGKRFDATDEEILAAHNRSKPMFQPMEGL